LNNIIQELVAVHGLDFELAIIILYSNLRPTLGAFLRVPLLALETVRVAARDHCHRLLDETLAIIAL
jgi:hypothetical protein